MFTHVDHLGFAVQDIDEAVDFYSRTFGVSEWERIAMPERYMDAAVACIGDTLIELITPTSEDAAFAKYLREHGPSIHHVAYRVDDIVSALAELQAQGVRLVDAEPRLGLHNTLVAFLHPKSTMGVLIELVQHQP
jgi:methylmalonyl-CoA/ethylmalonyl-CoA epimerase